MIAALGLAFAQLSDPAFRRVLGLSVLGALVVFAALWVAAWFGLGWAGAALSDWVARLEPGGIWVTLFEWLFDAIAVVAVLIVSFFLFPAVMIVFISLLLDDIAEAVERRHYPEMPPARAQPLWEGLRGALGFAAVMLALNLLALPVYLLLLFVPPLNFFVYYLLNGYLSGREYFELVAVRRLDSSEVKRMRRAYRGRLLVAGVIIWFLLSVPLVNLIMPIVATGFMLHVFERLRRREAARRG